MCTYTTSITANAERRGIEKSIEQMLKNGKTPEAIADFTGYDLEYVVSVQKKMLQTV